MLMKLVATIIDEEEALADAERATALRPDWAKGFSRKGAALYGLGRYAEAITTYEAGLRAEPGNAQMTQALRDVHARLQAARGLFEAASEGATARVRAALAAGRSAAATALWRPPPPPPRRTSCDRLRQSCCI